MNLIEFLRSKYIYQIMILRAQNKPLVFFPRSCNHTYYIKGEENFVTLPPKVVRPGHEATLLLAYKPRPIYQPRARRQGQQVPSGAGRRWNTIERSVVSLEANAPGHGEHHGIEYATPGLWHPLPGGQPPLNQTISSGRREMFPATASEHLIPHLPGKNTTHEQMVDELWGLRA
jgi:hypothetical protein